MNEMIVKNGKMEVIFGVVLAVSAVLLVALAAIY